MSGPVWLAVGAIAIGVAAAIAWFAGRRSDAQLSSLRQEVQTTIASQAQAVGSQMNHLVQTVTAQLGQVRQELHSGVAASGKLASVTTAGWRMGGRGSDTEMMLGSVDQAPVRCGGICSWPLAHSARPMWPVEVKSRVKSVSVTR